MRTRAAASIWDFFLQTCQHSMAAVEPTEYKRVDKFFSVLLRHYGVWQLKPLISKRLRRNLRGSTANRLFHAAVICQIIIGYSGINLRKRVRLCCSLWKTAPPSAADWLRRQWQEAEKGGKMTACTNISFTYRIFTVAKSAQLTDMSLLNASEMCLRGI